MMYPTCLQPQNLARAPPRRNVPDVEEGAEVPPLTLTQPLLDPAFDVAGSYSSPFTHRWLCPLSVFVAHPVCPPSGTSLTSLRYTAILSQHSTASHYYATKIRAALGAVKKNRTIVRHFSRGDDNALA